MANCVGRGTVKKNVKPKVVKKNPLKLKNVRMDFFRGKK